MTEFELIRTYFASQSRDRPDVRAGIGDDAAIVHPPPGMELAITSDVLVAGVHFFADADPSGIGHKSLAVNLSDLAAMGAEPAWFLLDISLPQADAGWLHDFAGGLYELARQYNVQLIGGDTTRGPLSIAITAIGFVPEGGGLLRSGARVGDVIYVTGSLGDAALALAVHHGQCRLPDADHVAVQRKLEKPLPRIAEGHALRALASSAIDVSDGLVADLGHVIAASGVGASIYLDRLPLSPIYRRCLPEVGWDHVLAGGDDYELCVTIPASKVEAAEALILQKRMTLHRIGEIIAGQAVEVMDANGDHYPLQHTGHDHFRSD